MAGDRGRKGTGGRGSSESPKKQAKTGTQRPPRHPGRAADVASSAIRGTSLPPAEGRATATASSKRTSSRPTSSALRFDVESDSDEDGRSLATKRRVTSGAAADKHRGSPEASAASEPTSGEDEDEESQRPKVTPKNKKKKKKKGGNRKLLEGQALEQAMVAFNNAKHPVDLRIYFCKLAKRNANPTYSTNETLYVGYRSQEQWGKGGAAPALDPMGAVVAVYNDDKGDLCTLTTGSSQVELKQAIERLIPDGYEFYPKTPIRAPKYQWSTGDGATYFSSKRKCTLSDFVEVESTGQFLNALVNYSMAFTVSDMDRMAVEALARGTTFEVDDDDDDDDDTFGSKVDCRVLELLVCIRDATEESSKKKSSAPTQAVSKVAIEIGAPVVKADGSYQVSTTTCLNANADPLVVDVEELQGSKPDHWLGRLKIEVMNYCLANIRDYKGKIHKDSRVYLVPKASCKTCSEITSTEMLNKYLGDPRNSKRSKEDGAVICRMRLAFSLLSPKELKSDNAHKLVWSRCDQPSDNEDSVLLSQPAIVASPPAGGKDSARMGRAAKKVDYNVKAILDDLYDKEDSPLYHGLTSEMYDYLMQTMHAADVRKKYALKDDGEEYPMRDLLAGFQRNKPILARCCNLLPERGAYPPDAFGQRQPSENFVVAENNQEVDPLAENFGRLAESIIQSNSASNGAVAVAPVIRGISFRRMGEAITGVVPRCDVLFEHVVGILRNADRSYRDDGPADTPFGKRAHHAGKKNTSCRVFDLDEATIGEIRDDRKALIFKIHPTEEGIELTHKQFQALTFEQVLEFAKPGEPMLPVGVLIQDLGDPMVNIGVPDIEDFDL